MRAKLAACAGDRLSKARQDAIVEAILKLDKRESFAGFVDLFVPENE